MIEIKVEVKMTLTVSEINTFERCMTKIKEIVPDHYDEYEFAEKMLQVIQEEV